MTTVRTIMLEGTHVPLTAECTDEGWNGFHVPLLTEAELRAYLNACQRNDRNGSYDSHLWMTADGLRWASAEDPTNRDEDMVWSRYDGSRFAIDGLVWVDYDNDEQED